MKAECIKIAFINQEDNRKFTQNRAQNNPLL